MREDGPELEPELPAGPRPARRSHLTPPAPAFTEESPATSLSLDEAIAEPELDLATAERAAPLECAPLALRAKAWAIDAACLALAAAPPLLLAGRAPPAGAGLGSLPSGVLFLALLGFAYGAIAQALMGATPGKRLLGLRVAGADGAPLDPVRGAVRAALAVVGAIAAGIGPLWAVFTRSGRGLHDLALDTVVVRVS